MRRARYEVQKTKAGFGTASALIRVLVRARDGGSGGRRAELDQPEPPPGVVKLKRADRSTQKHRRIS